jgi:hypothetical protein
LTTTVGVITPLVDVKSTPDTAPVMSLPSAWAACTYLPTTAPAWNKVETLLVCCIVACRFCMASSALNCAI